MRRAAFGTSDEIAPIRTSGLRAHRGARYPSIRSTEAASPVSRADAISAGRPSLQMARSAPVKAGTRMTKTPGLPDGDDPEDQDCSQRERQRGGSTSNAVRHEDRRLAGAYSAIRRLMAALPRRGAGTYFGIRSPPARPGVQFGKQSPAQSRAQSPAQCSGTLGSRSLIQLVAGRRCSLNRPTLRVRRRKHRTRRPYPHRSGRLSGTTVLTTGP